MASIEPDRQNSKKKIFIGPKKKIAFACSGGATKAGAFHLGVCLALQEQGFKFYGGLAPKDPERSGPVVVSPEALDPLTISTYVGSSAGSMISAYLAAGFSLDNIFNSFLAKEAVDTMDASPKILPKLTYSKMFKFRGGLAKEQIRQIMSLRTVAAELLRGNWESIIESRWLKTTGIFSTSGIEQFLREEVLPSNQFQDYLADLFIVATQLNHSRKIVFGKYHYKPPPSDPRSQYNNEVTISEACAASTALPFVFSPYPIRHSNGKKVYYIDGEIRDTLSTHVAADSGADLIIASYTHQPYHYTREVGSLTKLGLPAILVQSIYLLVEQKINNYIKSKRQKTAAIDAVSNYCKQQGLAEEHRKRICALLESELDHRKDLETIYIHPSPSDFQMFKREHFSLSPKKMSQIVKKGFRAATETLKNYEFADRDASIEKTGTA